MWLRGTWMFLSAISLYRIIYISLRTIWDLENEEMEDVKERPNLSWETHKTWKSLDWSKLTSDPFWGMGSHSTVLSFTRSFALAVHRAAVGLLTHSVFWNLRAAHPSNFRRCQTFGPSASARYWIRADGFGHWQGEQGSLETLLFQLL